MLEARQRIVNRWYIMSCHIGTVPQGHNQSNTRRAQDDLKSPVTVWHPSRMPKPRHFIKEWRLHSKLSQEEAGERMGYDRTYISKVESGKRRYDELFLEAAAKVYRCTPAELISVHPKDKAA